MMQLVIGSVLLFGQEFSIKGKQYKIIIIMVNDANYMAFEKSFTFKSVFFPVK